MRAWRRGHGLQACCTALRVTFALTSGSIPRGLAVWRCDGNIAGTSDRDVVSRRHVATVATSPAASRIVQAVSTVLRHNGPLPLAKLSSKLTDDDLEQIAEMHGGLMAFCHEHRDIFELESLPRGLRVVFPRSLLSQVAGRDRPAVRLAAALLVSAAHFPLAVSGLATPHPTTDKLLSVMRDVLDGQQHGGQTESSVATDSVAPVAGHAQRRCYCCGMEDIQHFRELLQAYPTLFLVDVTSGIERVALRCGAAAQGAAHAAITSSCAGHARVTATTTSYSPWSSATPKGRQVYALRTASAQRFDRFVYDVVPVTFFVPLHFVLRRALHTDRPVFDEPVTYDSLLDAFSAMAKDMVDLRSFTSGPEATVVHYVRRLSVQTPTGTGAMPLRRAAEMDAMEYNIFSLGERLTAEMDQYVRKDNRNRLRLFKGVAMGELHTLLSPTLMRDLHCSFASHMPNHTVDAGASTESTTEASTVVNTDLFLLIFDRLRHIFDVNFATAKVRPWAVLPPTMQPSSLTGATTPLPLVLAAAKGIVEAGPVNTEELYRQLPILAKMQLLALLVKASWCDARKTEAIALVPITVAVAALRQFIAHHSLFLFYRGAQVYTPQLAAEEATTTMSRFGGGSGGSKLRQQRMDHLYTRSTKAHMIFDAMPRRHPVALHMLATMPSIQALPFDFNALRPEFFRSFPNLFRQYEPFVSNTILYSRVDVRPAPPPCVLQPQLDTVEAAIKFIALLSIGGMTDSTIMNRGSREFRALVRSFGSCTQLVEQLPMWFEVRRDPYNVTGSVITYVGPYASDSEASLRAVGDADLPPLPVVLNETLEPVTQDEARGGAEEDDGQTQNKAATAAVVTQGPG